MLNYATLGLPFIRGFPSHELNDMHPLTTIATQVYAFEKFHFLKSTTSVFPFIRGSPSMNERKPFLNRWQVANYTSVKRFTFWKVSGKIYTFRVPGYKGVPLTWMKWNPSFNVDSCSSVRLWKVEHFENVVLIYAGLGFLFIRRFPSHEWKGSLPQTLTASQQY